MAKRGRSFFERLTGTVNVDDFDTDQTHGFERPGLQAHHSSGSVQTQHDRDIHTVSLDDEPSTGGENWIEEENNEGQLTVDVFNTPDEIVIKAIVAGVKPDGLDIAITRDMVTIRGKREDIREVSDEDYYYQELYWGSFSRTILLPQEIEVEDANATEKHGLLVIRLPKIDKEKQTKLKVKAG